MNYQYMKELTRINGPSAAPTQPHYVIIIFESHTVHTPGDERSRTNPGHGYPESWDTVESNKIFATVDRTIWQEALRDLFRENQHRKDILAYEVTRQAKVSLNVNVE